MTEVYSPPQDRPLVTFALFAYNQENYIREAVEGAFAQTYEPLEIILSDDCSSDRTFEIMQEMVAEYDGPHEVRVIQNNKNLGLFRHLSRVAQLAGSEVIVVAAGDDVSEADRVKRSAKAFGEGKNIRAVCTNFCAMGEEDAEAGMLKPGGGVQEKVSRTTLIVGAGGFGNGACYAYSRECFFWPDKLPNHLFSEDKILPIRAAILGDLLFIDEKLVRYRIASGGLTAQLDKAGSRARNLEAHWHSLDELLRVSYKEKKIKALEFFFLESLVWCQVARVRLESSQITPGWLKHVLVNLTKLCPSIVKKASSYHQVFSRRYVL